MQILAKVRYIQKSIVLLMFTVSLTYAQSLPKNSDFNPQCVDATLCVGKEDIVLLKKVYHFGKNRVELKRYKVGWYGGGEEPHPEDYEVYYTFAVYKNGKKTHSTFYKDDFIEIMDTPYNFPYVVVHGANLREDNDLTLWDFSNSAKVVQSIRNTRLDYNTLKSRRSPFLWNSKNNSLFSSYSNPIVIGNDGSYYLVGYKEKANPKCWTCREWLRVLYKFDGKKFQEYKTFTWDENSTKKINSFIWAEDKKK
jgi:hypothetical protein